MKVLKPKEQHERLLAAADKEEIVQHMNAGENEGVTKIAVALPVNVTCSSTSRDCG